MKWAKSTQELGWIIKKREVGSSRGLSEGRVWEIRGSDILEVSDKTGGAGSSQEVPPVSQQPLFTLQGIFLLPSEWEEQFGLRQPSQWLHLPMEQNLWGILSNSSNASGEFKGAHCGFLLLLSWFFEGQFETAFDSRNSGTARGLNLCRGWRRWADPSLMSRNPSVTTHSFCQIPRKAMAAKDQQSSYQANVRSGMCLHPSWKPTGKKVPASSNTAADDNLRQVWLHLSESVYSSVREGDTVRQWKVKWDKATTCLDQPPAHRRCSTHQTWQFTNAIPTEVGRG